MNDQMDRQIMIMIMIETEFITFHLTTNILAMEFIPLYGTTDNDID